MPGDAERKINPPLHRLGQLIIEHRAARERRRWQLVWPLFKVKSRSVRRSGASEQLVSLGRRAGEPHRVDHQADVAGDPAESRHDSLPVTIEKNPGGDYLQEDQRHHDDQQRAAEHGARQRALTGPRRTRTRLWIRYGPLRADVLRSHRRTR